MCDRHHKLIRELVAEIRSLREALEYAEERAARDAERHRRSAAEARAALEDERTRQWCVDWERDRTLKELERAQRWGDTAKAERLTRKLWSGCCWR